MLASLPDVATLTLNGELHHLSGAKVNQFTDLRDLNREWTRFFIGSIINLCRDRCGKSKRITCKIGDRLWLNRRMEDTLPSKWQARRNGLILEKVLQEYH
jgi:hypothetical protein